MTPDPTQADQQAAYDRARTSGHVANIPEAAMPYLIECEMWRRLYEEVKNA